MILIFQQIVLKTTYENAPAVKKIRFKKKYRIESLDYRLRKQRTNQEARNIVKAEEVLYMIDYFK